MAGEFIAQLAAIDTPTLCNAIELFEVRPRHHGYVTDSRIRANFPSLPPIVGYAATAVARSAHPNGSGAYNWLEEQVEHFGELSGAPIVVIQDVDAPPVAAMFGEIMCTTYKAFGGRGIITNGAGRDIDEVERLGGFQLYTNGEICSHGYFHLTNLHEPVEVGGLTVYPDDLLHADRNGITSVPKEIASELPEVAREFLDMERDYLAVLQQPDVTLAQFKDARAAMKATKATMNARLRLKRSSS
jgi:4-hydroxy-4-methyl-2-oxoglutarate aldolase